MLREEIIIIIIIKEEVDGMDDKELRDTTMKREREYIPRRDDTNISTR